VLEASIVGGIPSVGRIVTSWQPAPAVLVSAAFASVLYALGVVRRGRRWPARRTFAFGVGLLAVVVALDSGVDVYADRLVSIHMVQHLVLALVAAPLLVAGAPVRLALGATHGPTRRRLAGVLVSRPVRIITHPVSTWILFIGLIVGWHLSPLYELSVSHELVHDLEHLLLLTTAMLFWAQVVRVDPLPHPLGAVGRMLYLLSAMPAMSVIGVWLVVDHGLRYPSYAAPAHALGVSPLYDQHLAGVIMWGGDALIGTITLLIACGALLQEERRAAARDAYGAALGTPVEMGGGTR
jgi:putative copper resistance protein D